MGCWNGTCGLTQLPIKDNEAVDFLIILNQGFFTDASGFCYLTGYASPMSFLMSGSYNDYGSVEDIEDNLPSKLFLKLFREKLSEGLIQITSDDYYDKEVFGDNEIDYMNFQIQDIINAIERDRVSMKQEVYSDAGLEIISSNMGLLMFHKDILSSMINTPQDKIDSFNEKLTLFFNKNKEKIASISKNKESLPFIEKYSPFLGRDIDELRIFKDINYIHADSFKTYIKYIENETDSGIHFLKMRALIILFINLRKSWSAQSGKGSQSDNGEVYMELANKVIEHVTKDMSSEIGNEFYCFDEFTYDGNRFNENEEFVLWEINSFKNIVTIRKVNKDYIIPISLFKNHFEN